MAVNDLSLSVQSVGHYWQRRFLLEFILKFSSLKLDLYFINLFIGAIIVTIDLSFYEVKNRMWECARHIPFMPLVTHVNDLACVFKPFKSDILSGDLLNMDI